jgi:Late embryogenesis abundant protein
VTPSRLGGLFGALALVSCGVTPAPPRITPETVTVTTFSTIGMGLDVKLRAENPNAFDLDSKSLTAKVTLDGTYDVGTVSVPTPWHLPAKNEVELHAPLAMQWQSVAGLIPIASKATNIPFTVEGTVHLEKPVAITVPFSISGWVTKAEIAKLAPSALPKIPGLPL